MKKIIAIVGPSGSGKTSLGNEVKKKFKIPEGVSHTTRSMRPGEIHGISYYFVNEEEFKKLDKVEYSGYSENQYCLSQQELDEKLKDSDAVFVIVDINGYEQIKEKYPDNTISIFIEVTYDEMIKRMNIRGDSKENIIKRITNAIMTDELSNGSKCDYVLRNDSFSQAFFELQHILNKEGIDVGVEI